MNKSRWYIKSLVEFIVGVKAVNKAVYSVKSNILNFTH